MELAPSPVMLRFFAALALLLALLDHLTTWFCLRAPVPGWELREANPLAAWAFGRLGLAEGLALDTALTLVAVVFVSEAERLPRAARLGLLGVLIASAAFAVANNLGVIQQVGLLGDARA
jgi:hypothetical protein